VINQTKISWLIILEGINDIGQVHGAKAADAVVHDLIAAYEQMIDSAHAKSIHVYGATLTPFGGSFYDTPDSESAWKRSTNGFGTAAALMPSLISMLPCVILRIRCTSCLQPILAIISTLVKQATG